MHTCKLFFKNSFYKTNRLDVQYSFIFWRICQKPRPPFTLSSATTPATPSATLSATLSATPSATPAATLSTNYLATPATYPDTCPVTPPTTTTVTPYCNSFSDEISTMNSPAVMGSIPIDDGSCYTPSLRCSVLALQVDQCPSENVFRATLTSRIFSRSISWPPLYIAFNICKCAPCFPLSIVITSKEKLGWVDASVKKS